MAQRGRAIKVKHSIRGFTLIELLVALTVFSVVSLAAYEGLFRILEAQTRLQSYDKRMAAAQRVLMLLEREVVQMADRPIRDAYGDAQPALLLEEGMAEWSRFGRPNPAGLAQSGIWRIGYVLREERLARLAWPVLDRAPDTSAFEETVLEGVQQFLIEALQKDAWSDRWPPLASNDESPQAPDTIPDALRVSLEVEGLPPLQRTWLIASGGRARDVEP